MAVFPLNDTLYILLLYRGKIESNKNFYKNLNIVQCGEILSG